MVDLCGNPNLECWSVRKSKILMKSDCNFILFVTKFAQVDIYRGLYNLNFFSQIGMLNVMSAAMYGFMVEP